MSIAATFTWDYGTTTIRIDDVPRVGDYVVIPDYYAQVARVEYAYPKHGGDETVRISLKNSI